MKKFTQNDVIVNTIKVYPKIRFFVHSGSISYNDTNNSGVLLNDFLYLEGQATPIIPDSVLAMETEEPILTEDGEYMLIE